MLSYTNELMMLLLFGSEGKRKAFLLFIFDKVMDDFIANLKNFSFLVRRGV